MTLTLSKMKLDSIDISSMMRLSATSRAWACPFDWSRSTLSWGDKLPSSNPSWWWTVSPFILAAARPVEAVKITNFPLSSSAWVIFLITVDFPVPACPPTTILCPLMAVQMIESRSSILTASSLSVDGCTTICLHLHYEWDWLTNHRAVFMTRP